MAGKDTDVSWALKLMTSDYEAETTYLGKIWGSVVGATAGIITAFGVNVAAKRPLYSGLQKHIAFPLIGIAFGRYMDARRMNWFAEKDAVLRHYITLHPEDFQEPERKKWGEVLEEWIPIR